MKRLAIVTLSLGLISSGAGYVIANDNSRPYEAIYLETGYKPMKDALNDFENHYNKKLSLPLRVPPVSFTHYFGRLSDLDGTANDKFELLFTNDKLPENQYSIIVRPTRNKIPIKDKYISNTYKLNNGIEANYITINDSNSLVFEYDNWQYWLSVNKRIADKVPPQGLVNIANSIK